MGKTRIQLPPAANLSIAQFSDTLRDHGFIIEQLTDDRVQAQAPRSVLSDLVPFERWLPAARIIVERSAAGFTISRRPPFRRMAVGALGCGLFAAATMPGTVAIRLWAAAASITLVSILQARSVRRRQTLLAVGSVVEDSGEVP